MKFISAILLISLFSNFQYEDKKTKKAGKKMQEFVIGISKYAKNNNPDFIVIPQNGAELAFKNLESHSDLNDVYLKAIDGIGIEDLFFNEEAKIDTYRLEMLRKIAKSKKIIVSDYITDDKAIAENNQQNITEGFLSFPRSRSNEHYKEIPKEIIEENDSNITKFSTAKNFLYLINSSNFKTKAAFIEAIAATNFDVVSIDLFYKNRPLTKVDIDQLKTKANGGKRLVISYMNIGAAENWRYYWNPRWSLNNPIWLKKKYEGYNDEFYVEFWHQDWQNIIYGNEDSYLKKIMDAGFDGLYLDNVEAYYFLYN
jgi:cysteinyl-tRNA synthetase